MSCVRQASGKHQVTSNITQNSSDAAPKTYSKWTQLRYFVAFPILPSSSLVSILCFLHGAASSPKALPPWSHCRGPLDHRGGATPFATP